MYIVWGVAAGIAGGISAFCLYMRLRSPFCFPYFCYEFYIPDNNYKSVQDCIDQMILDGQFDMIENHRSDTLRWKRRCCQKIETSPLFRVRLRKFDACLDDEHEYQFTVKFKDSSRDPDFLACSYAYLKHRKTELEFV